MKLLKTVNIWVVLLLTITTGCTMCSSEEFVKLPKAGGGEQTLYAVGCIFDDYGWNIGISEKKENDPCARDADAYEAFFEIETPNPESERVNDDRVDAPKPGRTYKVTSARVGVDDNGDAELEFSLEIISVKSPVVNARLICINNTKCKSVDVALNVHNPENWIF